MKLVLRVSDCFYRIKIVILLLLFTNVLCFSQNAPDIRFIWIDNSLKASDYKAIFILSSDAEGKDTLPASNWNPSKNDTITFNVKAIKNPVYLEMIIDTTKKRSNKFNIVPNQTYNLTERSDSLEVKPQPLVFSTLNDNAQILYSFLINLLIELLLAIPVAALFRLPARLVFFVFVANIMCFPIIYVPFLSVYIREILRILLEGSFIFLIGWKRLKITKALLVSVILNVVGFGIYKGVMLFINLL